MKVMRVATDSNRREFARYSSCDGLDGLEVMSALWLEHSFAPHAINYARLPCATTSPLTWKRLSSRSWPTAFEQRRNLSAILGRGDPSPVPLFVLPHDKFGCQP